MSGSTVDLVTLGEAMAVVRTGGAGRLAPGAPAVLSFAGAESTVAIGVSRLGHPAAWAGRLGLDESGDMILSALRGEGVDVTAVTRDPRRPTGLLLRHRRTADRTVVRYHRRGSAGSRLDADQVPVAALRAARVLHLTGITPALGPGPARAVRYALDQARDAGVTVSVDVNFRSRLWPAARARPVLAALVAAADIVFAGADEAALVLGDPADGGEPGRLGRGLRRLGPGEAVVKLGRAGAVAVTDQVWRTPAVPVTSVDPVGAGDAFVAGYLSGWLDGLPVPDRLARAATCGAWAAATDGDWEGLPDRPELTPHPTPDVTR
nr:sugar kinase [Micromonospora sp. DSM 115978]